MRYARWAFVFGVFCAMMLLAGRSRAQSEKRDVESVAVSNAKSVPPAPPSSALSSAESLNSDPRLNAPVSVSSDKMTMADAVRKLRALTQLPLAVEGRQAQDYSVAFYFKNARLADALDALAAVRDFTWTKQPSGDLVLWEPYNPRIWDVWPNNFTPEQIEIQGLGYRFLRLYRQLPRPLQTLLRDVGQGGAKFYDLPPPLQENLRAMMGLSAQSSAKRLTASSDPRFKGPRKEPSPHYGPETKIVFYKQYQEPRTEGFPGYAVSITGVEGTWSAAGFFDWTEDIITRNSPPILLDYTAEDAASRQIAATKEARLNRKFTVEIRSASFAEALLKLSSLTGINFAAEFWNWNWETQNEGDKRSFTLRDTTLKDILNRLASDYHYSWSWRPSGAYVWHPAFKPYLRH